MPLNLIVRYSNFLDIAQFPEPQRTQSLYGVFKKDIEENINFKFRTKQIWPTKKAGVESMQVLFDHLTKRDVYDAKGKKLGTRTFEMARSQRLHWIKYHIDEIKKNNIEVFSYIDRVDGKDVIRTYIYDTEQEYIIILQPQNSATDYYLLSAYHLNEPGSVKQINKKLAKKLPEVY